MSSALMVAGKVVATLVVIALVILIWETGKYFNKLADKYRPLIAWDMLMLFLLLVLLVVRL